MVNGGDEEDRTPDLRIANATLSQLSYIPIHGARHPLEGGACKPRTRILALPAPANNARL